MSKKVSLEICIDSVQSAIEAQKGGAIRVELCDNLFDGGTTPSIGMMEVVRKNITIAMNVIIRPRGGDFCYSDLEFEIMKKDIEAAKKVGVDGVVIGILTKDGEIDIERNKELIELARPMSVTFHRAFDMVKNPYKAIEDVLKLGADRLLTSGCEATAYEGMDLIKELVEKVENKIIIMPGGGINERNIKKIVEGTGVKEVHGSFRKKINSSMDYRKDGVFMGGALRGSEFQISITDSDKVTNLNEMLNY